MIIKKKSIKSILTLRYDPYEKPILDKIGVENFRPTNYKPSLKKIENIIIKNLKKDIVQDKKSLGISLSGGVDSTLVLAYSRNIFKEKPIHATSIKFSHSVDETKEAEKIARKFNAEHHVLELENYLEKLPAAIKCIKLPFWDIHWYYVANFSKNYSKYLLSGDGGDEIFGGYTFRYQKFLTLLKEIKSSKNKVDAYLQCHERDRVLDQKDLFGEKVNFNMEEIFKILNPYFNNFLNPLEQVFLADFNGKLLYNFSIVNSKIAKNFNLKLITPLISKDLIEYMMPVHWKLKYNVDNNSGKLILRKLLEKFQVESLVSKNKLGFNVNTVNLWKEFGYSYCKNYLLDGEIIENGLISKNWIKNYINKKDLDVKYINKFLGLLALEIWYRIFITKEMKNIQYLR